MNKDEKKLQDKVRKSLKRSLMTKGEKEKERKVNRDRIATKRSQMTQDKRDEERIANRKRNAIRRSQMSKEEREKVRAANRKRNANKRSQMTKEERANVQAKDRERKNKNVGSKVEEDSRDKYVHHEREYNRLYKEKMRTGRSDVEHEYEIVNNLISMRCMRNSRSGKDHLLDNLDAKRGMRKLKEEGRLRPFQQREFRELTEIDIWRRFVQRGKEYANILKNKNPKFSAYIEEMLAKEVKERIERYEQERQKEKEREEKGYWYQNPVDGDVWWTGKEPPGEYDFNPYISHPVGDGWQGEMELTDKEWEELQAKWYQETLKERKEEERLRRNEVARENYHKRKEELLKPISMPQMEISEYERIREENIKERNEALKAAGWLDCELNYKYQM